MTSAVNITTIDGKRYQATNRRGMPAIRRLDRNNNTSVWIHRIDPLWLKVCDALKLMPADEASVRKILEPIRGK